MAALHCTQSAFAGRSVVAGTRSAPRPVAQARSGVIVRAEEAAGTLGGRPDPPSGGERGHWFPGNEFPPHLDGSLPGDAGFDPLSLGSDPTLLKWFQQAELVHSRTAMVGVAGILIPDLATQAGVLNVPQWYESGKIYAEAHPEVPQPALLFVELLLAGWAESKRLADYNNPGSQGDGSFFGITDGLKGQDNGYPGGVFDPFGFSRGDADLLRKYKENEIKNGRLAMVAFLGFIFQHAAYPGKGPIQNLVDHLQDPYNVTFATNGVSLPFLAPGGNVIQ